MFFLETMEIFFVLLSHVYTELGDFLPAHILAHLYTYLQGFLSLPASRHSLFFSRNWSFRNKRKIFMNKGVPFVSRNKLTSLVKALQSLAKDTISFAKKPVRYVVGDLPNSEGAEIIWPAVLVVTLANSSPSSALSINLKQQRAPGEKSAQFIKRGKHG
jgi:hypothetical protein